MERTHRALRVQCAHVLAITHAPNTNGLVFRRCNHVTTVVREARAFHTATVPLENK